jgi:hypothetical protein
LTVEGLHWATLTVEMEKSGVEWRCSRRFSWVSKKPYNVSREMGSILVVIVVTRDSYSGPKPARI